MNRITAQLIGWFFIIAAVCVQLFNDFTCYREDLSEALSTLWFPALALVPAIIFIFTSNPLRAVTSSIVVMLLYGFAYYVDCIRLADRNVNSMVYLAVVVYGTPLAAGIGLAAGPLCRLLNTRIDNSQ